VFDTTYPWQKLTGRNDFLSIPEATSQEVWGQTRSNEVYYWNSNCYRDIECNKWILVESIPEALHNFPEIEPAHAYNCEQLDDEVPVLSSVTECIRTGQSMAEFGSVVYFALREDGSILKWSIASSFHLTVLLQLALIGIILILGLRSLLKRSKNR
jgi:hypothetical protein